MVYLIDYQSLRKLDCLQIIRKWLFSLKNKSFSLSCGGMRGGGNFTLPPVGFPLITQKR